MNKYFNTLTNARGDSLPGYRAQVVDSAGVAVSIYADDSGTAFTDSSGNPVNYATASTTGKVEFYWTAATGQTLQVLDVSGNLVDATADFANNFTLSGLPGEVAATAVTFTNAGTGAVERTAQAKMRETLSVFDFIPVAYHAAIQDGTTAVDVTSYITSALTYAQTTEYHEKTIVFPAGTYRVSQLALRDVNYTTLHAEGTVNITGIDGAQGWIMGDDRLDELGHVETFTRNLRITGGPWLVAPAVGQTYARGLKLQNFVDCVFDNILVSGTYTPTGGTGNRIGVEIDLSFNNTYRDCTFGYPGAPIGADKSYALYFGNDSVNNNRFYSYRSIGGGPTVANTVGVRIDGLGNCFYGGDISSVHTCFEDNAARGCHRLNMYHEAVSRVLNISFASTGCVFMPSYVDIAANGTAYDLGGDSGSVQTIGYKILGGLHKFNASGTTGIKKGTACFGLTYQPGIDTASLPATASTGTDNGSGGGTVFNDFQITAAKIAFPDTPVASSSATTLDCYKEENFTPGLSVGATAQTAAGYSAGKCTKIGRLVTVTGVVGMGAAVSGTGNLSITGLPYTALSVAAVNLTVSSLSYTGQVSGWVDASQTKIELFQTTEAGTRSALTHANLTASSEIEFSLSYMATA